MRETTSYVQLQIALRDGEKISKTLIPLKHLEQFDLIKVFGFAIIRGIDHKSVLK